MTEPVTQTSTLHPYLEKDQVLQWLMWKEDQDAQFRKARRSRTLDTEFTKAFYRICDEADRFFRPTLHGLDVSDIDKVVLDYMDELHTTWPDHPLISRRGWPAFDPTKFTQGPRRYHRLDLVFLPERTASDNSITENMAIAFKPTVEAWLNGVHTETLLATMRSAAVGVVLWTGQHGGAQLRLQLHQESKVPYYRTGYYTVHYKSASIKDPVPADHQLVMITTLP